MRGSLKSIKDLWKFRLRMALAQQERARGALATPDELSHLVGLQTAYWNNHQPVAGAAAARVLNELNERSICVFVFSVRGRHIEIWDKPSTAASDARNPEHQAFLWRAMLYRAFLAKAIAKGGLDASFDFALGVNDMPVDSAELPIFGFQKERGAHNLLMPDVDFFHSRWYRRQRDPLPYEQKTNSACFVGSSTGGSLSADDVRRHATPRLRAASYFHGNPRVVFTIANAVQCQSDEARACLMSQPYFSSQMTWEDQLKHRFLISMDGNGAACSRLVKGLFSNSAVIKYESPHELYYFPALEPGTHYLPALHDQDVDRVLDTEATHPGTFKAIAEAGQRFAHRYLTIHSVTDYTVRLLRAYAALVKP